MKAQELIQRAQAIGVTFTATDDGRVICEGPITPTLAGFLEENTSEILNALQSEHRVIDFERERARRLRTTGSEVA